MTFSNGHYYGGFPSGFGIIALATLIGVGVASPAELGTREITFTKDIAPILQAKCESCHRPGQMAPMALITYQQVRPWAKDIRERVAMRQMPPWHLDPTVGIQSFQNDMSLSNSQIDTIVKWVAAGAPQGDPKDMPAARQWPEDRGWQLASQFGQPDLVIKSEPYTMPARAQDAWFRPLSQIPLTEPRWVRAVEIRPASAAGRKITHHALAYLQQEEPGSHTGIVTQGLLMEWAVNKNYDIYRPNTGKLLVPGARIWWEMHYHAVGEEIRDNVELAIYLYPKGLEPKYRTYLTLFRATPPGEDTVGELDIPPNSVVQSEGYQTLKAPARLENFQPHMHLRGKAMLLEAILPDGTKRTLSYVDHFNFNWMTNYIYSDDAAPVLPKGTVIHVVAWHDNTVNNKNNPDPDQWVGWGDRTVDEMAHAWVNVTYISEDDYKAWFSKHEPHTVAIATH
jgi:hypothetical protein